MSPDGQRTKRQRLTATALPHVFVEGGLGFRIDTCHVNETEVEVRGHERAVSVTGFEEWKKVHVEGTVDLPSDVLDEVFPADERLSPPGKILVTIQCRDTILRDKEIVASAPLQPGSHTFSLDLPKPRVKGVVQMEPVLVRQERGGRTARNFGRLPGVRLATGEPWIVEVDEADVEGLLLPRFERFSEQDWLPGKEHLHYLDATSADKPILYLNADHGAVVDLMDAGGSTGARARLRDTIFDFVEMSVWPQLLLQAATHIREDGTTKYEWQEDVIDLFYEDLYEEVEDREQVVKNLRGDIRSSNYIPTLAQRVDKAVQKRIDTPRNLLHLLEEGFP